MKPKNILIVTVPAHESDWVEPWKELHSRFAGLDVAIGFEQGEKNGKVETEFTACREWQEQWDTDLAHRLVHDVSIFEEMPQAQVAALKEQFGYQGE